MLIVIFSNFISITIYFIGAIILLQIGIIWMIIYIMFVILLEIRLLAKNCVNCYYYGKRCAFGKGKISALFFKKGDPQKFKEKSITMKDIIPDFLFSIIPLLVGTILLIFNFNWFILILMVILFLFAFIGVAIVRRNYACKYCKQRELGCPAEQLFDKTKK